MSHNVLITGASGYLGGTLLNHWNNANLPSYNKLFALVRNKEQAENVQTIYGAEPLTFSPNNEKEVEDAVVSNQITIVIFMIGAYYATAPVNFVKALAKVQDITGTRVHFVYTSGTKQFSDTSGADPKSPLLDTDPNLYEKHKMQRTDVEEFKQSINTNITIINTGETHRVRTYIFSPCMVYGEGEGFGNKLSIQTVDLVSAAKATGHVYRFSKHPTYWPVCHITDNTGLYIHLVRKMLSGEELDHGKHGFYLASSGSVAWDNVYHSIAKSLAQRGIIQDHEVHDINNEALQLLADALGVDSASVPGKISGNCSYTAKHGVQVGWNPQYAPEHILNAIDEEVAFILENLSESHRGLR